jgi:hypothetical protein
VNLPGEHAAFIFVVEVTSALKMEAAWTIKEFIDIVVFKIKPGHQILK